jgi:uncharacterized membrane protein YhiD involved in acid resistance
MSSILRLAGIGAGGGAASIMQLEQAFLSLLLAFVLGQLAAWIYIYTHAGISYSRSFVQSIVLLTIIVALAMMVIGNNIVVAFGLIGALTVIRFRNILKDTRDTAFVFFSLVVGMACGTGTYRLAIFGTLVFCLVLLYLHWSYFGSRHTGDGFVRFQIEIGKVGRNLLQSILNRYCRSTHLVSQRFQESGRGELAYRLTIRDPGRADELVDELQHLEGVSNVTFVLHEEQAEI